MTRPLLALCILFLTACGGGARVDGEVHATADSTGVIALIDHYVETGEWHEAEGNPDSAACYYRMGVELGRREGYTKGLYDAACSQVALLNNTGQRDSALVVGKQLLEWMQQAGDELLVAHAQYTLGSTYAQMSFYETALVCYRDALTHYESAGNTRRMGMIYNVMQTIYLELDAIDKAVEYGEMALELTRATPSYPYALLNTSNSYSYSFPRQYEKAGKCLDELLLILKDDPNPYLEGLAYNNMGDLCLNTHRWGEAGKYFRKAVEGFERLEYPENALSAELGLAYLEFYKGNNADAERMARKVLAGAEEYEAQTEIRRALAFMGDLSIARKDFRAMRTWYAAADSVDKVSVNEKVLLITQELREKYETEKKETRISILEEERHSIMWLSVACSAALLLILVLFLILWRWTAQKKRLAEQQHRLAEQQVAQLEQERQLIATQSVLDGETAERTRLARDLHDGLGSMLTGVKLNLETMKNGASLKKIDVQHFETALGMLGESMTELRRVAHHLMPDSLSRYGLKTALADFCGNFPQVEFSYFGSEQRLDPKMEVMIYRIVHELVNNALKHSGAGQVMVQVMRESSYVAFIVRDDGTGFNPAAHTGGMGLRNIRDRVATYNGRIEISSGAGRGTEINIEFSI